MTSTARARRSIAPFLITLSIVFASFLVPVTPAQQSARQPAKSNTTVNARPRLVLLIVVDQFRYDYLDRFGDLFGTNGLRRLQRDGASWVNSNYDHMPTYTAPGHATLMTGAYPAETGIVGNDWPDRETGKRITSVSWSKRRVSESAPSDGFDSW